LFPNWPINHQSANNLENPIHKIVKRYKIHPLEFPT
jgi:hypothetical protein